MNNTQQDDKEFSALTDDDVELNSLNRLKEVGHVSATENNVKTNESLNDTVNASETDKEANATAGNPLLPDDDSDPVGLINPDGSINWECPCLGGMTSGPCGEEFKGAFSCFHYSEAEPKGLDCLEQFKAMQDCFLKHPDIYGDLDDDLEDEQDEHESTANEGGNKNNDSEEKLILNEKENDNEKIETEELEEIEELKNTS